uniref:Uncharacterized protein n=1 Tax=Plectus sambesii TaxID=2011161 RepID=A0A914VBR9_9BILA
MSANDEKRNGSDCINEADQRDTFANAIPSLSRRGCFCLLPFGPEPVRSSLINQVIPDSSAIPPLSRRGCFCLLPFGPEPVRSSLINQVIPDSSNKTLLTPCLVWTLGLHVSTPFRTLRLKPSTDPGLLLAGLQAPATTPGRSMLHFISFSHILRFCAFRKERLD